MLGYLNKNKVAQGIFIILMMACLQGCRHAISVTETTGNAVETKYSELLKMEESDGFTRVDIKNPWDTTKTLQTLILVREGAEAPSGFDRKQIIKVPLKNSVVYSSVHADLLEELGVGNALAGVCDAEYIYSPETRKRIETGAVKDCGSGMSPNVEAIISLNPGAVLLSPYDSGSGHGKLDRTAIPIVECADYMETSPLGRAEWIKFFGRLYGKGEMADSLFKEIEHNYLSLKGKVKGVGKHPKVLLDRVYGGAWSVPGGNSYMSRLIEDAGGENPFAGKKISGSYSLSPEKILMQASDADVWLIRHNGENITYETLGNDRPLYRKFAPYINHRVFVSDTSTSRIFEDAAFHPYLLLGNLIRILHPDVEIANEKEYFEKLQ